MSVAAALLRPVYADVAAEPIRDLEKFWQFAEGDREKPVTIDAAITVDYYDPEWRIIWGRNAGRGQFFKSGDKPLPIETGRTYRVQGMMAPSTGLTFAGMRISLLPDPAPVTPQDATSTITDISRHQNEVIRIEGIVQRQSMTDPRHQMLDLLVGETLVRARIYLHDDVPVADVQDSVVRMNGVYLAKTTQAGKLAQVELWVMGAESVVVVGRTVEDPRFNLPATPIEKVPFLQGDKPVRVVGTVRASEPGKSVSVRDRTGQIKIFTAQTRPAPIGQTVEAVGTPSTRGADWSLHDGLFRPTGDIIDSEESPQLRLAEQVLDLRADELRRELPVKLTGVITWADKATRFVYIQDASGGVRVRAPDSFRPNNDMVYGLVEVTGVTAPGAFAPEVAAARISLLGPSSIPVPRPVTLDQALTGAEASQWIEMRGYLRAITHDDVWTQLWLISSSGEFTVKLPRNEALSHLIGAQVRAAGVCVVEANARQELTAVSLLSPSAESIVVEDPAPPDVFSVPERTIASLRQFSPLQSFNRRVRLTAQVIHHVPGRYLFLQDGEFGMLTLTRDTVPLKSGDRVEVSGLPGRERNRLVLRESVYRRVGEGDPISPFIPGAEQTLDATFDGRLVRMEGRVLEASQRGEVIHLVIQTKHSIFEARIEGQLNELPPVGAEIRATGVYQSEFDEYQNARGFQLLLRSPSDLEILQTPSWWTAGRALSAAGLLFGCVLMIIGWVSILRRRVKQQTAQLRDQLEKEALLEARHRDIIDNASDFIFTLDDEGRLTSFNPAGERMTGLARDKALGRPFHDLLALDESAAPLPIFSLRSENDPAVTCQTRFKTADDRIIWVEICARALRQSDQPNGLLGVARDISERKQIEEELLRARDAAEANTRAKSAFLANMSHEIRTPMNGVIGMSNLLLDTRLSDEQRDFAETIRNSAESLLTVLNDILDFSKIEAGKLQFETIDFDLHETVESTLELLAARASDKGLELASYLPAELPRWIRGDPGRLRQVLINLIGNAIKFTEKGEVVIAVALERETDDDVHLHFEITDTGPGLDADTQSRLFQPFSQADGSTTRKFGGTGLGLAISKQIVHLMEGQIGVRSSPGHGATFWFTARLDKQPYGGPREQPPRVTALSGLRALIVDDNATNRKILQHYCVSWGVRGEPVTSGAAALASLRDAVATGDPFQLVLTDYQMPEMDGLMLSREIQNDSRISGARVVLLTSWDRRFTREELSAAGVIRMLVKPIRQQDLLGALLRCVRIGFGTNSGGSNLPSRSNPPAEDPAPRVAPSGRSLRVLVAEDNIVNQRVASLQLRNLGHTVEIAANGLEVLKALETSTYDVIFMDGQMPELDGYQTTRRIRLNPATSGIRIIAMTANAMQGDRERCLEAGMDDYISKPTRPEDLQAALIRCSLHQQTPTPFSA